MAAINTRITLITNKNAAFEVCVCVERGGGDPGQYGPYHPKHELNVLDSQ